MDEIIGDKYTKLLEEDRNNGSKIIKSIVNDASETGTLILLEKYDNERDYNKIRLLFCLICCSDRHHRLDSTLKGLKQLVYHFYMTRNVFSYNFVNEKVEDLTYIFEMLIEKGLIDELIK